MNHHPTWLSIASLAVVVILLQGCGTPVNYGPAKAPSPGAVTGVHHILLAVSDLDQSIRFYRDVLGMRLERRMLHFAMLEAGGFGVVLSTRPWDFEKKGAPKGIGMIPHFTTPNMGDFAARMKRFAIPWLRQPVRESYGIEAFITDPDGYQWAVVAPRETAD
jgi:lactoylglutathione lyase